HRYSSDSRDYQLITPLDRNSFPTRRSSDLDWKQYVSALVDVGKLAHKISQTRNYDAFMEISEKLNDACANCHKVYRDKGGTEGRDRKSTRLNSSHGSISYAVFCLKKKKER